VLKGSLDEYIAGIYDSCPAGSPKNKLDMCMEIFREARQSLNAIEDTAYRRLCDWPLAEITSDILCGCYLVRQSLYSERKKSVAAKFLDDAALRIRGACDRIKSGERAAIDKFEEITRP